MFKSYKDKGEKVIIGLVHLRPMPGTVYYEDGDFEASIEKAKRDAVALEKGGAHGCLLQTVDRVYPNTDDSDYVRATCLAVIANEVKKVVSSDFKVGVQIMWNCITPSLAVAKAVNADFTRATSLIGGTESPFGRIEANPLKVFEYRKKIEATNVNMIAEIFGYHFKDEYDIDAILANVASVKMVGGEAVEVMGHDNESNNMIVNAIKAKFPDMPIVLGGGTNLDNVKIRMENADVALVGSCFENSEWGGYIDESIVRQYMTLIHELESELKAK